MLFGGKFIQYKYKWNGMVILIFWLANGLSTIVMYRYQVCLYHNGRIFTEGMTFPNIDGSVWWARLNTSNFSYFRSKLVSDKLRIQGRTKSFFFRFCKLLKQDQYGCISCKHKLNLNIVNQNIYISHYEIKICIYIKNLDTAFQIIVSNLQDSSPSWLLIFFLEISWM